MKKRCWIAVLMCALLAGPAPATAIEGHACFGSDTSRRIEGCTSLLQQPNLPIDQMSQAYAMRALAYSLLGRYATAIKDYDEAIRLMPEFPIALNNRAWAYFKWGKARAGLPDVQNALALDPASPHAYDTRAHIYQWLGQKAQALADYDSAMRFGGSRMIRLYQCGLQAQRFYNGPTNGIVSPALKAAMKACVAEQNKCDPLPPDEECKIPTS